MTSLAYHDYTIILTSLDAEWTRGPGAPMDGFKDSSTQFDQACNSYRDSREKNREAWSIGRMAAGLDDGGQMASWLFKARTWIPFGHADLFCMVLADDLDAGQSIVELYPKTIEEVTLGFCPDLSPHVAGSINLVEPRWFIESDCATSAQTEQPLLSFVRLKLEGLLTIGRALVIQAGVFRLIARTVVKFCETGVPNAEQSGITPEDQANLRVAVLDLQDEEEIGLLMAGSNYSAAMALTAILQNFTIKDLLESEPELEREWITSLEDPQMALLEIMHQEGAEQNASLLQCIGGGHLFRWSRTGLAFNFPVYQDALQRASIPDTPPPLNLRGWVLASVGVNISPGHRLAAEKLLADAQSHLPQPPTQTHTPCYHLAGTTDLLISPECPESNQVSRPAGAPVRTADLILLCGGALHAIGTRLDVHTGRHLSGWASQVQVPIPWECHKSLSEGHRPLIAKTLQRIAHHFFPERNDATQDLAPVNDSFNLAHIRNAARLCGIPLNLRRSLVFLFENFGTILANPRLFEVVLDYADFFLAFYQLITKYLPDEMNGDRSGGKAMKMGRGEIEQLALSIDALTSALDLRLRRVYPDQDTRDWSVDFRSSLSQSIAGGEACLKAAARFVRDCHLGAKSSVPKRRKADEGKPVASVAFRLTFEPGITARPIQLYSRFSSRPPLKGRPTLAIFEADVAHITNLRAYCDFFHEAYHLIYEDALWKGWLGPPGKLSESRFDLALLLEEVFVQQLMWLTLFDEDPILMIQDFCHAWSTSVEKDVRKGMERRSKAVKSEVMNADDRDLNSFADNFANVVIGILCGMTARNWVGDDATQLINKGESQPVRNDFPSGNVDARPPLDSAVAMARALLAKGRGFITGDAIRTKEGEDVIIERFALIYDALFPHLSQLWGLASTVFTKFANVVVEELPNDRKALGWKAFRSEIDTVDERVVHPIMREAKSSGVPVPGCALDSRDGEAMDGQLLILGILRGYLRYIYEWSEFPDEKASSKYPFGNDIAKSVERPFDPDSNKSLRIVFKPDTVYSNLLIDPGTAVPFSCSPTARRRRLVIDTCVTKMLWDAASRQRRRRLRNLLQSIRPSGSDP